LYVGRHDPKAAKFAWGVVRFANAAINPRSETEKVRRMRQAQLSRGPVGCASRFFGKMEPQRPVFYGCLRAKKKR
jgi:hypothetical protein